MNDVLNLERFPLDRPESAEAEKLAVACRAELAATGMFNLEGFVRPAQIERAAGELLRLSERDSYVHRRSHNVYFSDTVPGIAPDHPALRRIDTINHTLCGDQIAGSIVERIYEWAPLRDFLARVLVLPRLFLMDDRLARLNVMEYRTGMGLNWHFDRSHFTTTLLLQAAQAGGEFEYRSGLRGADDPNYGGVARALAGDDPHIRIAPLRAGTLNVFAGRNTLHRVSPVTGSRSRLIAVLSYYEKSGVKMSAEDLRGFYGRAE
jgi:hypothetical protein